MCSKVLHSALQVFHTYTFMLNKCSRLLQIAPYMLIYALGVLPTVAGVLSSAPGVLPAVLGALKTASELLQTAPRVLSSAPRVLPSVLGALKTESELLNCIWSAPKCSKLLNACSFMIRNTLRILLYTQGLLQSAPHMLIYALQVLLISQTIIHMSSFMLCRYSNLLQIALYMLIHAPRVLPVMFVNRNIDLLYASTSEFTLRHEIRFPHIIHRLQLFVIASRRKCSHDAIGGNQYLYVWLYDVLFIVKFWRKVKICRLPVLFLLDVQIIWKYR